MIVDISVIAGWIGAIVGILTPIIAIIKWISTIVDRIETLEENARAQEKEINDSKEERLILLKGTLACLQGLHEMGANGPTTKAIEEINQYLIKKTHN